MSASFVEEEDFERQRANAIAVATEVVSGYENADPPPSATAAFLANVDAWRILRDSFEVASEAVGYLTAYTEAMAARFGTQAELDRLMAEFGAWASSDCGVSEVSVWFFSDA